VDEKPSSAGAFLLRAADIIATTRRRCYQYELPVNTLRLFPQKLKNLKIPVAMYETIRVLEA